MKLALATAAHEGQLRHLLSSQSMPGWIRLAFACEPDWFAGQAVFGSVVQTIVATDEADAVVGCSLRAVRQVYVDGCKMFVGYLGGLRLQPEARGACGLARGFRFLQQLHESEPRVPFYLTTIVEANRNVAAVLTSRRAGLPTYLDQGRLITSAIFLERRRTPSPRPSGVEIRPGTEVAMEHILTFLREEGRCHQFFPALEPGDLGTSQWRGLAREHFRVALRGNAIVAVAAAWDQTPFRQTMVTGYAPALRLGRPLINVGLRLAGRRALPVPGRPLAFFHLALLCIQNNDADVFAALLERFHTDYRLSPYHCFVVGLHERDPARAALRRFRAVHYSSRIYLVCWEEGRPLAAALDPRSPPHLETGTL